MIPVTFVPGPGGTVRYPAEAVAMLRAMKEATIAEAHAVMARAARLVSARSRRPCTAASTCSALAVFPLDASIRVCPRAVISPRSSRIMPQAIRSFTEPNGLQYSSLAYRSIGDVLVEHAPAPSWSACAAHPPAASARTTARPARRCMRAADADRSIW